MKNGRREKRNETDTSRGMEKKKVVGEPQVEERVEGWDWRRLLEPPRVYLICERLPPPRVSITPVRTWPCHATTRPIPLSSRDRVERRQMRLVAEPPTDANPISDTPFPPPLRTNDVHVAAPIFQPVEKPTD